MIRGVRGRTGKMGRKGKVGKDRLERTWQRYGSDQYWGAKTGSGRRGRRGGEAKEGKLHGKILEVLQFSIMLMKTHYHIFKLQKLS